MKNFLKNLVRPAYYLYLHIIILAKTRFLKPRLVNYLDIPIIINNRNRLTDLKKLIYSLEKRGYKNIYIIDNNSTYPPLLDYYQTTNYRVFKLQQNVGFLALWQTNIYKEFINNYYVYTDSDVELIDECPQNVLQVFRQKMETDNKLYKIGLSLKIDDLPNSYLKKEEVLKWEKKYYQNKVDSQFFLANVDTTFALYRPWYKSKGANIYIKMYRSNFPYQLRHLPWYVDSKNLSLEEEFYIKNASQSTHWTKLNSQ